MFYVPIYLQNFHSDVQQLCALVTKLSNIAVVVLLCHSTTDENEAKLVTQFTSYLSQRALPAHRILFYSTIVGKTAQIRQLKPKVHFEYDSEICLSIGPFVQNICFGTYSNISEETRHRMTSSKNVALAESYPAIMNTVYE